MKKIIITLVTSFGSGKPYQSDIREVSDEELATLVKMIELAISDKTDYFKIPHNGGDTYFPSEVVKTSIITIKQIKP